MSKAYAEQVMRDHCTITWDIEGQTIRDTTDAERMAMLAEQAEIARIREMKAGILEHSEVMGLTFARPGTTKYVPPRESYEELSDPLAVRKCRWPRKSAA